MSFRANARTPDLIIADTPHILTLMKTSHLISPVHNNHRSPTHPICQSALHCLDWAYRYYHTGFHVYLSISFLITIQIYEDDEEYSQPRISCIPKMLHIDFVSLVNANRDF